MSTLSQFVGISSTICPSSATITLVGRNVTSTSFDTSAPLGSRPNTACGFLLCKSGGVAWIVAPRTSQVTRTWYNRNDAVTVANNCTGCIGVWFIPTCSQLLNPGYICRQYWDHITPSFYWSSSEHTSTTAFAAEVINLGTVAGCCKYVSCPIRSFRCVTY